MEENEMSGIVTKPDGTTEYWWNGKNFHNVLPEEIIDAELAASSLKKKERNKRWH